MGTVEPACTFVSFTVGKEVLKNIFVAQIETDWHILKYLISQIFFLSQRTDLSIWNSKT